MKKFFTAMLAAVMTLCLFAGCNNEPETQDPTGIKDTGPVGMLVLSAGASLNITYDADGLVLSIEGNNEAGIDLTDKYADYLGKTCAAVAKELVAASAQAGYLSADVKNIVIKQSIRSQLPGSNFLETIETEVRTAAEAAGSAAVITLIDESNLDEQGYINLETAKALLCNELGVEKLDAYYGSETADGGSYLCTVEIAGTQTSHNIDAVTGLISEATEEELLGDPDSDETDPETEVTEAESIPEEIIADETVAHETEAEEPTEEEPTEEEPTAAAEA